MTQASDGTKSHDSKADGLLSAWINCERNLSNLLSLTDILERVNGGEILKSIGSFPDRTDRDAAYYRDLHSGDDAYKINNWLLSHRDEILRRSRNAILEIGCGNCRFTYEIAPHVREIVGIDWAPTPTAPLPSNARIMEADITKTEFPHADLCCSADFLEHLTLADLKTVLPKFLACAQSQYHVISCYDDHHSHLVVMPPGAWEALFKMYRPDIELSAVDIRRGDPRQVVAVISTRVPSGD